MFNMKLKPIGLSRCNILVMFLAQFSMYFLEGFVLTLLTFTLKNQYQVDNIASVSGDIAVYCEILGIVLDMSIGFIFDIVGRRVPLAVGYLLTAIGLVMLPFFNKVYPWFLMSRLLIAVSQITGNCPFVPDYIQEESQALANGYFLMIVSFANILSSTVLLKVSENMDPNQIYKGTALFITTVSALIFFKMKDVIKNDKKREQHSPSLILKQVKDLIKEEPFICLGIWGDVCTRVIAICCTNYTTYAVNDAFNSQGRPDDDKKDYLALIFLVSNISAFFISYLIGSVYKYFKVTSLILTSSTVMMVSAVFMVYDLDNISWIFTMAYCVVGCMNTSNFVLTQTMVHGVLKKESRASVLSI